ncbi:unnamed protein product [Tuber melanosporum]|jgi:RimJ/RimL family protein N-acetyltransferase|uniref:(Perigord truffle) hypothetical protein n=1 Tax=Tuber melanosporum (strain Mel28) TaxID=656061 RepID=D5GH51_TUBMM|nr:uncharacterized protein GSTUM_00007704001 [Tuber melanosporum]CAZ83844.1 unnamed protein product [Tuber melanosporum]
MAGRVTVRAAVASDIPVILEIIKELALYEKEPDKVLATEESLHDTLGFKEGSKCYAKALLLYEGDEPAGMALYFNSYSTWRAKPGIYLEDLFVRSQFRGKGYGTTLLAALAKEVLEIDGARLEWSVLKWNEPSIKFYEGIGATNLGKEWQQMRVDGDALENLARRGVFGDGK